MYFHSFLQKIGLAFDPHLESGYAEKRFEEGRVGFSVVLWVLAILNPPYIILELIRADDPLYPIIFRLILEVLIITVLVLNHRVKNLNHKNYPFFYAIPMEITYLYMVMMSHVSYPNLYSLYLPNITTIYFFIHASFTGLRFAQGAFVNILTLGFYCVYAYSFSPEPLHTRQIPALVSMLVISMLVSYLLERFNRRLFLTNESIIQKNKTIEQINKELSDRNDLKSSLISVLSHDINSPLNSIKSLIQVYRDHELPKEQMLKYWDHIDQSVDRVLGFTKETIEWVKQQMNDFQPNLKKIEIKELVDEVIDLCITQAEIKGVKIEFKIEKGVILSDEEILKIALRNLISNAIKYSHEGNKIEVIGTFEGKFLKLSVQDYGIGIEEKRQSMIFNKHMSNPGTQNERGSGLGLSFSNMLIQRIDGAINLESEVGKGSCFTLTLALKSEQKKSDPLLGR